MRSAKCLSALEIWPQRQAKVPRRRSSSFGIKPLGGGRKSLMERLQRLSRWMVWSCLVLSFSCLFLVPSRPRLSINTQKQFSGTLHRVNFTGKPHGTSGKRDATGQSPGTSKFRRVAVGSKGRKGGVTSYRGFLIRLIPLIGNRQGTVLEYRQYRQGPEALAAHYHSTLHYTTVVYH